jgi:hypothetical protein
MHETDRDGVVGCGIAEMVCDSSFAEEMLKNSRNVIRVTSSACTLRH